MEWGCMQALIDFDGWRKWKDFSQNNIDNDSNKKVVASAKMKAKKNRMSLGSVPSGISVNKSIKEEAEETKQ
jgi:osomolarity two-component system, response regulator SSK1